jgi:hypothetical protein
MAGKEHTKPQIDKFRDLARQLETDDDEARFDERLKRLATAPRTASAGEWRVKSPKTGGGFYARFTPHKYGPENNSPVFQTQEEVDAWLLARGCRQDPADPDKWFDQ